MKTINHRSYVRINPVSADFAAKLLPLLVDVNYDHLNYRLRGGNDYNRAPLPSLSYDLLRHDFEKDFLKDKFLNSRENLLAKLLVLNMPVSRQSAEKELGADMIASGIRAGLFVLQESMVRTDNLCLSSYRLSDSKVIYFFSDAPSHYFDKQAVNRVYSNHDSYLFKLFLSAAPQVKTAKSCLELGSGSAMQLIALSKENPQLCRSIGLEIDQRARTISQLNIELNGLSDRISIISDPAQAGNFKADLIISNPPFLPCPRSIELEGDIFDLKSKFPLAGYGGIHGLDTTSYFLELTERFLADRGNALFFGQYAKSRKGYFFIEQLVSNFNLTMSLRPFYEQSWINQSDMSTNIGMVLLQDGFCNAQQAKKICSEISAIFSSHGVDQALTAILSCHKGLPAFNYAEQDACFKSENALFTDNSAPEHLKL